MKRVLYIVNPQNDFVTGSMKVESAVNRINALVNYLKTIDFNYYDHIKVSLDWHPINHCSFVDNGGKYPLHCVEYTNGALVETTLMNELLDWMKKGKVIFYSKGLSENIDESNAISSRLNQYLVTDGLNTTDEVDICGINTTGDVTSTIDALINDIHYNSSKINVLVDYTVHTTDFDEIEFLNWIDEHEINSEFDEDFDDYTEEDYIDEDFDEN